MATQVTDPELLSRLNAQSGGPVTDPALIQRLERQSQGIAAPEPAAQPITSGAGIDPGGIIPPAEEPNFAGFLKAANIRAGSGFTRFGTGLKDLALEVLEREGFVDEGTSVAYKRLTEKEREDFERDFDNEFGDSFFFDAVEFAAEASAFAALPGGVGARASLTAKAAAGAGAGAVAGGTAFVPERGSRGLQTTIGAAGGAAGGALFAKLGEARQFFAQKLREALTGTRASPRVAGKIVRTGETLVEDSLERSRALVKDGLAVFDRMSKLAGKKIPLKVSNLTDDPEALSQQAFALTTTRGQRISMETEKQQIEAGVVIWNKVLDVIGERGGSFARTAQKAFNRVLGLGDEAGTGLLQLRERQAARDFGRVAKLAPGVKIPIEQYRNVLAAMIADARNVTGPGSQQYVSDLMSLAEDVKDKTSMGVQEFRRTLSRFGSASDGNKRILSEKIDPSEARTTAKRLFGALQEDLNATAQTVAGSADIGPSRMKAAGLALVRANNNYKEVSNQIREIMDTSVGKIFNLKPGEQITNDVVERKFLKMGADEIESAIDVLGRADPATRSKLQLLWVSSKLDQAQQAGRFNKIEFSPGRMFDLLKQNASFEAVFPAGTANRKLLEDAFDFMSRTVGNVGVSVPSGIAPRLKEGAGLGGGAITTGVDGVFMARFLAPLFANTVLGVETTLVREGIEGVIRRPGPGAALAEGAIAGRAAVNVSNQEARQ